MKRVTTEMIENWIGSENFDELSSVLASVLNGDYEIDEARNEILEYDLSNSEELDEESEEY